jgi:hypothetical protein
MSRDGFGATFSIYTLGVFESQLRYFTVESQLVPTPIEAANQAQANATQAQAEVVQAQAEVVQAQAEVVQAQAEAEQAQAEVARLAEQLRSLGIEPQS